MASNNDTHVVFGAGALGTAVARLLKDAGARVRLYRVLGTRHYDMLGTTPDSIDGTQPGEVRKATDGASVIYLCLNAHYVDWATRLPPIQSAVIEAASKTGATVVSADPIYMYGNNKGRPYTENLPYADKSLKGRIRGEMADQLMEAHRSGQVKAVIGRFADLYGPGALNSSQHSTFGERVFYPVLAGQTVSALGNINLPHSYPFVDDVARALIVLGEREEALGQVWHIPGDTTTTSRALAELAFEVAGHPPSVRGWSVFASLIIRLIALLQPEVREVANIMYQWTRPFVVDASKFERTFGSTLTPQRDAVRATLDWYRANSR